MKEERKEYFNNKSVIIIIIKAYHAPGIVADTWNALYITLCNISLTCVCTHLWEHQGKQEEGLVEKRGEATWEDGTQAQFPSLCLEPHHLPSSGTRFPPPPSPSFSRAVGFIRSQRTPPYPLHLERFRSTKQRHLSPGRAALGDKV